MTEEPNPPSKRDSLDVGCIASCSGWIACLVGAIFSVFMLVFTGSIAGIMGTGLGALIIWHILMGCILLACIYFITKRQSLLRARIYRVMAALGFAFGYAAMWMSFTFSKVQ